jgi:hypothetical protein
VQGPEFKPITTKKKKRERESNNVKSQGIEDGDVSAMEI